MTTTPEPGVASSTDEFIGRHRTYLKRKKFTYSWVIHDFPDWLVEIGTVEQYSPVFPDGPDNLYKWKLVFLPGEKMDDQSRFGFRIRLETTPKSVNVKYEISISNSKNIELKKRSSQSFIQKGHAWGWSAFIARDELLNNLPNDVLIVSCKIEVITEIITDAVTAATTQRSTLQNDLGRELECLVGGQEFGDVKIIVGERKFLAYKGILAARSPVFAAMFKHDMEENTQNTLTITDLDHEVFKELLRYIYTDRTDEMETYACELFAAADKYCIEQLKELCQQTMLAKLSIENAAKILKLADLHHATEMKTCVLQFLCSEASRGVTATAEWNAMAISHPHLVCEVLEAKDSKVPFVKVSSP